MLTPSPFLRSFCLLTFFQCVAGLIISTLCRDFIRDPDQDPQKRADVFLRPGSIEELRSQSVITRMVPRRCAANTSTTGTSELLQGLSSRCLKFCSPIGALPAAFWSNPSANGILAPPMSDIRLNCYLNKTFKTSDQSI